MKDARGGAAARPRGADRAGVAAGGLVAYYSAIDRVRGGQGGASRDLRVLLRSFVRGYRDHMRKEDQEFFPYASCSLAPEEWADLADEITDPTDPLVRTKAGEELDKLLSRGRTD